MKGTARQLRPNVAPEASASLKEEYEALQATVAKIIARREQERGPIARIAERLKEWLGQSGAKRNGDPVIDSAERALKAIAAVLEEPEEVGESKKPDYTDDIMDEAATACKHLQDAVSNPLS